MKRIRQYYNLVLSFIRHLVIGERYYTELEVALFISKMQHEMAQEIIGNRSGCARIIPLNYFQDNGKYGKINVYELLSKHYEEIENGIQDKDYELR